MRRLLLSLIGALGFSVFVSGPAVAWTPPLSCTGPLGETTVSGDVVAGAGCDLTDTTVTGSVLVLPGGTLGIYPSPNPTATTPTTGTGTTQSKTRISGYVLSYKARRIEIRAGWIGGGVLIGSTTNEGTTNGLLVENTTILGDVLLRRGKGFLFLQYAAIGGDVYVANNTGNDSAGLYGFVIGLYRSTVAGNVILYGNQTSASFLNAVGVGESTIGKDLLVQANTAKNASDQNLVVVRSNVVGGNVSVNGNRAIPLPGDPESLINSFIEVSGNTVGSILACRDNTPDPVLNGAAHNTANAKRGECAGL